MPAAWFPKTRPGLRARPFSWPVRPVAAAPGQVLAANYRKFPRCSMNRTFDVHAADGASSDRAWLGHEKPSVQGGRRFSRACGLFPVSLSGLARPASFLPALPGRCRHILRSWPIPVRSAAEERRMNDTGKPPVPGRVRADETRTATPPRRLSTHQPARARERPANPTVVGRVGPVTSRSLHAIEEAPMLIFHKLGYPTTLCSGKARMSPLSKVEMSLSRRGFVVWENGLGLADNERAGSAADRGSGRGGR